MTPDAQTSLVLAAVIAAAGVSGVAAAMRDAPAGPARRRLLATLAVGCAGGLAAALTSHALVFWIASAAASLSIWPMIGREQIPANEPSASRARRMYLACAIAGETLLAAGLVVAIRAAGTEDLALLPERAVMDRSILVATTLILLGGGLKAGAAPLHAWLPVAVRAASTPAAIVVAGVTSRIGQLALIRLLPLGLVALDRWGVPVVLLGMLGMFYGAVAGARERDARGAIGYVCVSQAGLVVVAIGLGLVTSTGWPALRPAVLAAAAHGGLAIVALYLGLTAARLPGARRVVRTTALMLMAVVGLSLAGAPLTGGAAVMALMTDAVALSGLPAARGLVSMLLLAAAATTVAMSRVLWLAARPTGEGGAPRTPHDVSPTRGSAAIGLAALTALAALGSPVLLAIGPPGLAPVTAGLFVWPGVLVHIGGGAAIAGLAWHFGPRLAVRR